VRPRDQLIRVDVGRLGEGRYRRRAQARDPQPPDGVRRKLAERNAQRMRTSELVVAIGRDEYRRHRLDTPPHDTEHVERRLVGPVDVFQDDHSWAGRRELLEQRRSDPARLHLPPPPPHALPPPPLPPPP